MAKNIRIKFLRQVWSEAVPFVAQSPRMKVDWLVGVIKKQKLTCVDIAPYMRLLLMEFEDVLTSPWQNKLNEEEFVDLFNGIDKIVLSTMIESTDLCDVPILLELMPEVTVEDAVLILTKRTPSYEKDPQIVIDRAFMAVYKKTSDALLDLVAEEVDLKKEGGRQFESSWQRFKEIMEDEKILSSMFPQAK